MSETVFVTGRCTKVEEVNADGKSSTRSLLKLEKAFTFTTYDAKSMGIEGELVYGKTYQVILREVVPEKETERKFREEDE